MLFTSDGVMPMADVVIVISDGDEGFVEIPAAEYKARRQSLRKIAVKIKEALAELPEVTRTCQSTSFPRPASSIRP